MYDMDNEIIVCNSTKTSDIKDIDKAIKKLKLQEKKLVDLYLSSSLNVEAITKEEREKLQDEYYIFSSTRIEKEDYSELDLKIYMTLLQEHFYENGVNC